MRKIIIRIAESEQITELDYVPLDTTWVGVKLLLQEFSDGCLVECRHKFMQTQFILDGAEPCMLIVFDENQQFVTSMYCSDNSKTAMSYLISEPLVIILPENSNLPVKIQSIKIINKG